jgi:hypothetical protein
LGGHPAVSQADGLVLAAQRELLEPRTTTEKREQQQNGTNNPKTA